MRKGPPPAGGSGGVGLGRWGCDADLAGARAVAGAYADAPPSPSARPHLGEASPSPTSRHPPAAAPEHLNQGLRSRPSPA